MKYKYSELFEKMEDLDEKQGGGKLGRKSRILEIWLCFIRIRLKNSWKINKMLM